MKSLYQRSVVIKRLKLYFHPYICLLTKPSGEKMFLLLLSMMSMQCLTSVKYLYQWFLSGLGSTSLNSYYYLLRYTKIPMDKFYKITVKLAISLIPSTLCGLPIFLVVDDTLQEKYGTHFECHQKLFDHAKHNGTNYLKGHCFVGLAVRVPVFASEEIRYLSIPIGFRLRCEGENKLQIASSMIDTAMEVLKDYPMVILLCDSWYPKGAVITTVKQHDNLEIISSVRVDTSMFDLKPEPTGKRGRPAKKGKKLSIFSDFHFVRIDDYFMGTKAVLTNLFESTKVYATVTTTDPSNPKAYRVFISSVLPEKLNDQFGDYTKKLGTSLISQPLWLLPFYLYTFRWSIEVLFYEQKTFWSFGLYKVRSKVGIENFVNFSSICYACTRILPYMDSQFSFMSQESAQTGKYVLGEAIKSEIFFTNFASKLETPINSNPVFNGLDSISYLSHFNKAG